MTRSGIVAFHPMGVRFAGGMAHKIRRFISMIIIAIDMPYRDAAIRKPLFQLA